MTYTEDEKKNEEQIRNLASFHCPITLDLMTDPVIASDGITYDRRGIEQWRNQGGTSPFTREVLRPDMIPNLLVLQIMNEFRRLASVTPTPSLSNTNDGSAPTPEPKNLSSLGGVDYSVAAVNKLGKIFATLDPLRDTLSSMLDGWAAPQIMVIGNENSGKSTLLERLTMIPLFPRDRKLCTRMPIEVKLRRGKATPVIMHLVDVATSEVIEGSEKIIAAELADTGVSEQMSAELERVNGSVNGVCHDRRIVIHLTRPDLPNLDFLDMPGLVAGAMRNEPEDMREQTQKLVEANVERVGDAGLFLWTASAVTPVNQSLAADIINHPTRAQRTIGVITKPDLVSDDDIDMLCDQVTQEGDAVVELQPNGFVATMLKTPMTRDDNNGSLSGRSNIERLIRQAKNEEVYFNNKEELARVVEADRGGCNKLIDRLGLLVNSYVGETWAPQTIARIDERMDKIKADVTNLGRPYAHTSELLTTELKTEVCQLVAEKLAASLPSLMKEFAKSVLFPFKTTLMALTHDGLAQKVSEISDVLVFTEGIQSDVETECLRVIKSTQVFLQSHVLEPLTGDFSDAKLGRFENLISVIRGLIETWLLRELPAVHAEICHHGAAFFNQLPTNTVFVTAFELDSNGDGGAEIKCDGLALWNTLSRVLVKHVSGMTTMLKLMLDEDGIDGGLDDEVRVEACAIERIGHLLDLKKLEHAKSSILKLIGMSMDEMDVQLYPPIRTFDCHSAVQSLCFANNDNTKFVTGSSNNMAQLWDVETGSCIRTFTGHTNLVLSVCFTSNDAQLVTGSFDKTAKLWNVATGQCVRTYAGHTEAVLSVCLTHDDTRLITGSRDKQVKLWDTQTGECVREFTEHTQDVNSVCLSRDNLRLVSGSDDNTAKLWDVETGKSIRFFIGHTDSVEAVCLASDDKLLVTGSFDNTAKLWDVETGSCIRTFTGHTNTVMSVCLTSNFTRLVTGSGDNTAKLWDVETGACIRTLTDHADGVNAVCFANDDVRFLSVSDDCTIKLWGGCSLKPYRCAPIVDE